MQDILHVLSALPKEPARQTSDRDDPAELSDKLADLAVERRDKYGEYDRYRLLIDAADALEVMGVELAEARAMIEQIRLEVRDLTEQLATYRVIETVPATRETPAEYGVRRATNDEDEQP